jgi:hypothetical protein
MKPLRSRLILLFSAASLISVFSTASALAQPITAANDGTGTSVITNGNRFDVQAGKRWNNGANPVCLTNLGESFLYVGSGSKYLLDGFAIAVS